MGLIRDKLAPCPICGGAVLGRKVEYEPTLCIISCSKCGYEFAAKRKQGLVGGVYCGRKLSNEKDTVQLWNALPRQDVVFCKDCQHCRLLDDGESFSCQESEMDYYAPTYSAATYYCADGKRRDGDVQS